MTQAVGTRWFARGRTGDANGPIDSLKTIDAQDSDIGVYLQDSWKPTERLTLNLGLRSDFVKRYDGISGASTAHGHPGARATRWLLLPWSPRTGGPSSGATLGRVHEQMNGRDNCDLAVHGGAFQSATTPSTITMATAFADHSVYNAASGFPNLDPTFLFDPDIGQPFVNEAILGIRRQFQGQFAMDVGSGAPALQRQLRATSSRTASTPSSSPARRRHSASSSSAKVDMGFEGRILQQTNNTWSGPRLYGHRNHHHPAHRADVGHA